MARAPSNRALSQLVTLITALIVVATLYFARVVLVPFVLAILFAFLLTPVVRRLDRMRIPRAVSSAVVLIVAVGILGTVGWVTAGQLVDVANQLPTYRSTITKKIEVLRRSKNQRVNTAANAVREVGEELAGAGLSPAVEATGADGSAVRPVPSAKPIPVQMVPQASNPLESLNTFIGPVSTFGIVTIFALFMLIRREDLRNRLLRLAGQKHLNVMTQALDDAGSRVSRYLLLQLSVNILYGFIVGVCLYFIGVPHVFLWGALAALLRFVPYLGFVISSGLPILMSIAMFDGWMRPILTFVTFFVLEMIVANVVEPFVYGTQVGLSSLAILVAAVFWTLLWGPVGLVLSTPLTVCLVVIGRYMPNLGVLNILLGDEPVLSPESQFYQRLLASDQQEARSVLEHYLTQNNNLQQLYDSVLIPALFLAEQDRHRNDLDEATQQFIAFSTKELVEEFYDRTNEEGALETGTLPDISGNGGTADGRSSGMAKAISADPFTPLTIACVPARDDADEIIGTMLAQLAERAGHRSQCVPVGPIAEIISGVEDVKPDVICISALPPFAVSHARTLYLRLRARLPAVHILMGLWGSPGDPAQMARRMRLAEGDKVVVNLTEAIAEIAVAATAHTPMGDARLEPDADMQSLARPLVAERAPARGA